jgi:putative endonuclease
MTYHVYILANRKRMLYIRSTNNLPRRLFEHKLKLVKGYTEKYSIGNLVYFETYDSRDIALRREPQVKGWLRRRKTELNEDTNPLWKDLSFRFIYPQEEAKRLLQIYSNKKADGVQLSRMLYHPHQVKQSTSHFKERSTT